MTDRKRDVVGLAISMPILATLAVALRIQARVLKRAGVKIDDYLTVAALVFSVTISVAVLISVYAAGFGSHLVFVEKNGKKIPADVDAFLLYVKMMWILQWATVAASGFTKLSVLFLYRRIFITRWFRVIVWAEIGLCTVWLVGLFFWNFWECPSFKLHWRLTSGSQPKCIDIIKRFWVVSISDVLLDVMILFLPWRQIWKLNMPAGEKVQVGGMFLLGFFVVGADVARLILAAPAILQADKDPDHTFSRTPIVNWTVIMVCVGVISACLPTFRPLFAYYRVNEGIRWLKNLLRSMLCSETLQSPAKDEEKGIQSSTSARKIQSGAGKTVQRTMDLERDVESVDSLPDGSDQSGVQDSEIVVTKAWGQSYEAR